MTHYRPHIFLLSTMLLLTVAICGCSHSGDTPKKQDMNDVIVAVGDSALTVERVVAKIPSGLSAQDSLAMFNAIVEDWLRERLLCDIAEGNLPHPEMIEQRVREYRNRLIALEYRKLMGNSAVTEIPEDSVRAYFDQHRDNMFLTAPLIRGLYIKVPTSDQQIADIRQWIAEATPQSVDKLEKHGLSNAMQYDHFTDRWVDWQTVAEQIPFRFGDPDRFLSNDKVFETEYNGSIYLLHITEVLHTGEPMPYEYASVQIRGILADADRAAYDKRMLKELYDKGVKDNRIVDNRR